jgi:putative membrane protein
LNKLIRNFFNGLAFGITETVPGVSGGTIAIILGFYYELIETVNHFTEDVKKYARFIIPLGIGMVTGLVLFSSIVRSLLTNHSLPTMLFFIGLIAGIIPLIYNKVREPLQQKPRRWGMVAGPVVLLVIITYLKGAADVNFSNMYGNVSFPFMLFILVAGIVAAAALVIPGVSGSFVLLLIGIYPLVTHSVSEIPIWLTDIRNVSLLGNICKVLIPLGIGIIIGGLSMARLIENLLKNYHTIIYSIL